MKMLDRIREAMTGRARLAGPATRGGPQGGPGESAPGEPGYDGAVHVGDEGADPALMQEARERARQERSDGR